jgi:hypothetical protein
MMGELRNVDRGHPREYPPFGTAAGTVGLI